MRINDDTYKILLESAEINSKADLKDGYKRSTFDILILDIRDLKEAVKILQDRLKEAEEKNKALQSLSDSHAEALNMMEMGRL